MIAQKYSMDLTIKLNEEFTFHHPILNETVTVRKSNLPLIPCASQASPTDS